MKRPAGTRPERRPAAPRPPMTLGTRLFLLVFSFYFGLTAAAGVAIYSIAYGINLRQLKSYLSTNVQYNAESTDKSLLRISELLIYPAYIPTLYDKAIAADPARLSEAQRILLRRDLEMLFALNTYVPLRTYFPTSRYVFALDSALPAASLFSAGTGSAITTTGRVSGEPWYPEDDAIKVTPDPDRQVVVFSRRIQVLEGGSRHLAGVLAIEISDQDLTLAQDAHPVSSANLFFLKTPAGDLLRITPDTGDFPPSLFEGIQYRNNRAPASDVRSGGVRYLMQPFRMNSGWELICLVPYGVINRSLTPLLVLVLTVDLLTLLVLLYFARTYIPRLISAPIARLSERIGEVIRHDDYSRNLPAENSSTELSRLYESFNGLMAHITRLIARIYDENERSRKAEVLALQAQINPHFLYNALDSIGWTLGGADGRVSSVLSSLSSILRYGIGDPNQPVPLAEEVEIVRDYIAIQEFCYSLPFRLEAEGGPMEDVFLPRMTLQPLVENAILHGIRESEDVDPVIRIAARLSEGFLEVSVENHGKSPDLDELERILHDSAGVRRHGLANVDHRLRLRYGDACGLRFEIPAGGGLVVRFRLPA